MVGDKSDNISGVNGIGPVKATEHILNDTVPINDPDFINSLKLVTLEYDLDVPDVGELLYFDSELVRSRNYIRSIYNDERAFTEIQLALNGLKEVYS